MGNMESGQNLEAEKINFCLLFGGTTGKRYLSVMRMTMILLLCFHVAFKAIVCTPLLRQIHF